MECVDGFLQVFIVDMGINFSCDNGCMTKHLLDIAQIGAALKQMRGK